MTKGITGVGPSGGAGGTGRGDCPGASDSGPLGAVLATLMYLRTNEFFSLGWVAGVGCGLGWREDGGVSWVGACGAFRGK